MPRPLQVSPGGAGSHVTMQVIRPGVRGYAARLQKLRRRAAPDPAVRAAVAEILEAVARDGDEAVLRFTEKFGGPRLKAGGLLLGAAELQDARRELPTDARRAISAARTNVRAFARRSLRKDWMTKNKQGAVVGERFDPFERVGIYVPGGTAPLVSTAVMTCTLAAAAGVREIVAATPPARDGRVHPALLAALAECGATEVYLAGGAQAISALAFGTRRLRPVQKIFGPGNAYVVEAKRQVFGHAAIDLLPGPSEILVIADDSAEPEWIAADLLAQCEHGEGSCGILLTESERILGETEAAIERQARASGRPRELARALKNAVLVLVKDVDAAVSLANDFAAEHVSIATRRPEEVARRLTTSGALFVGGISPVVAGDFLAGPSHELPTGGAGKSFAGLTADQFQRRTSIVKYDAASLRRSLPFLETFSRIEGLDAHGRSAAIRLVKGT